MSWTDGWLCQNKYLRREAKAFLGHHQGNTGPQQPVLLHVGDATAKAGLVLLLLFAVGRQWEDDDSVRCQVTVANDGVSLMRQV